MAKHCDKCPFYEMCVTAISQISKQYTADVRAKIEVPIVNFCPNEHIINTLINEHASTLVKALETYDRLFKTVPAEQG